MRRQRDGYLGGESAIRGWIGEAAAIILLRVRVIMGSESKWLMMCACSWVLVVVVGRAGIETNRNMQDRARKRRTTRARKRNTFDGRILKDLKGWYTRPQPTMKI